MADSDPDPDPDALAAFSRGEITALDLRRRLDGVTYGEVLRRLGERGLPAPRSTSDGREARIARAREWLFPAHAA